MAYATDLPFVIYNNPPRVKSDLHWTLLLRILKHSNYVVHKESTTRIGQVSQVLAGNPDVSVMCCESPKLRTGGSNHVTRWTWYRKHDRQHYAGRTG
ncbi:MAG: hypothetical protein ACR5LD_12115 [Symbiopectobacterium sp.]